MKAIWKFPLSSTDQPGSNQQTISVPDGARFLTAQMQGSHICLWAVVDPENAELAVSRVVYIVGTGNPTENSVFDAEYVGTIQERVFVWHVFVSR